MDKKSKVLLILFVIFLVLSVGYTFYKTVVLQDFEVVDTSEEESEGSSDVETEEESLIEEE